MPLTQTQQTFLDNFIRQHRIKGRGKRKRAEGFEAVRMQVLAALKELPKASPKYATVQAAIDAADAVGDRGTFNAATEQMRAALASVKDAIETFDPLPELRPLGPMIDDIKQRANATLVTLARLRTFAGPAGAPATRAALPVAAGAIPVFGLLGSWAAAQQECPRDTAPLGNLASRLLD